ncbi:uncharacterized protein At4g00950-like [Andrographis paniculata]|uniref:uncharacterized protein At4g00950-like n=1 Tax=Andrographis paniculata TaxID=175694 RepID=UPI0021E7FCA2|nr:uncharacterized protein At4g00950-like [Andrographis paniculata]
MGLGHEEEDDVRRDPTLPPLTTTTSLPPLPLHIPIPSTATIHSPDHPSTPPLQAPVSVPFRWEELPGKPRSSSSSCCCNTNTPPQPPPPFKLELPPANKFKFTRTPSPATVLDGPAHVGRPKFSSFRWFRERDFYGSPHGSSSGSSSNSIIGVEELLGSSKQKKRRGGFFGRIKNGKRVVDGGSSCRFSPSSISSPSSASSSTTTTTATFDSDCSGSSNKANNAKSSGLALAADTSMTTNGSFSSVPASKPSHFLASIYQGLKQVIQRKSGRKSSKEGQDY